MTKIFFNLLILIFTFYIFLFQTKLTFAETPMKSKKTIVLIHGLTGDSSGWSNTKSYLENEGFKVVLFNLPGHGGSKEDLLGITLQDWIKSVQEVLDKESENGKVAIYGHSMGGLLAVYVANLDKNSSKVDEIVTYGAAFQHISFKERVIIFFSPLIQIFKPYYAINTDKEIPFTMLRDFRNINDMATRSLKNNHIPYLAIHGTNDESVPIDYASVLLLNAPNTLFSKYPGGKHYPNTDEEFNFISQKIIDFIDE